MVDPKVEVPTNAKPSKAFADDGSITHLGVTYSITHFAHQSETPLETCPACGGSGQLYTRKCKFCKGRGLVVQPKVDSNAERLGKR